MKRNFMNESLLSINNINIDINTINNSYQNMQNNRNYDLEPYEEENFKQIDLLMRKIMND